MTRDETIRMLIDKYQCPIWTEADGNFIPYKLLTERRLLNNIACVKRAIEQERLTHPAALVAAHAEALLCGESALASIDYDDVRGGEKLAKYEYALSLLVAEKQSRG